MDFAPRVEYFSGALELDMRQRISRRASEGYGNDIYFDSSTERLRLDMLGYVYHPRFLIFQAGGAVGLLQSSSDLSGTSTRASHTFNDYNIDATFLPEHPYHLELFTRQQNGAQTPFTVENMTISSQGAIFGYKQRPLFLNLSAISTSYDRSSGWSDAMQYNAAGSHVLGPMTNSAGYSRTDTTTSQGLQSVRTDSHFSNTIGISTVSLTSSVGTGRQRQSSPADVSLLDTDTSLWSEHLIARLPLNFTLDGLHDYRNDETTTGDTSVPALQTNMFTKTTTDSVAITHSLYSSLRTSYSAARTAIQSENGDYDSLLQVFALNYAKKIPGGDLHTGYSFQDVVVTRKGTAAIVNEGHQSAVPGVFALNNPAANAATVTILVRDPNPPQDLVALTVNVNYTVQQLGNTVQIAIVSLPASINPPATSYSFVVSYFLLPNDSEIDIKTNSFNLGFNLFDGMFSPYASYSTSTQNVISGSLPGNISDTISITYGYSVQIQPFRFLMERTDFRSDFSPYRSLRTLIEYRQAFEQDIDVTAHLAQHKTDHQATITSAGFEEKMTSAGLTAHKALPRMNIDLFMEGNYTVLDVASVTSTNYTLNPSLRWHVGKLDVSAIATRSYSESVGPLGKSTNEEDAYFLFVSRKLF